MKKILVVCGVLACFGLFFTGCTKQTEADLQKVEQDIKDGAGKEEVTKDVETMVEDGVKAVKEEAKEAIEGAEGKAKEAVDGAAENAEQK